METDASHSFEDHRGYLQALAYRMLGSFSEGQDVVQDAWLRQSRVDLTMVDHPRAYLSRIVTNLCLDRMQSARARREQYVGCWLPEPLEDEHCAYDPGPMANLEYAQSISIAFMLTLERLTILERAAFLLHDVFDQSYEEISHRLARSEATCRQLAARARKLVQREKSIVDIEQEKATTLLKAFVQAISSGDVESLAQLLTEDVVMLSDGGGIVTAVPRPLNGVNLISRTLIGFAKLWRPQDFHLRLSTINSLPAVILYNLQGQAVQTTALSFNDNGQIKAIYAMRNPQKLAHLNLLPS
ncbi:RNA polymerase sigma factor SigJ [Pseudomonas sp. NPDC087697]|uniref:RNA polymerase sigma factor SigJ n=1 Tax=Pseudomonas sp. NPDC087697 TaxID=3364447 RepID=UPI0038094055